MPLTLAGRHVCISKQLLLFLSEFQCGLTDLVNTQIPTNFSFEFPKKTETPSLEQVYLNGFSLHFGLKTLTSLTWGHMSHLHFCYNFSLYFYCHSFIRHKFHILADGAGSITLNKVSLELLDCFVVPTNSHNSSNQIGSKLITNQAMNELFT